MKFYHRRKRLKRSLRHNLWTDMTGPSHVSTPRMSLPESRAKGEFSGHVQVAAEVYDTDKEGAKWPVCIYSLKPDSLCTATHSYQSPALRPHF